MCRAGHSFEEAPVVCVTGANGFLGTEIVTQCLKKGYRVRGTVRNAADLRKTQHLRKLPGAATHLALFSAEMGPEASIGFEEAFTDCSTVFHTASPFSGGALSTEDVHSAVFGTLAVLRASERVGVKTVVMTSAMGAATPEVDGDTVIETNWADAQPHVQNGNKFVASKILAERAAWEMVEQEKPQFRFVTILPSCIVGPSVRRDLSFTNRVLLGLMKNGWQGSELPNESFSLIDVRDCAAQHIAAMEQQSACGRYFSAAQGLHLNDMSAILKEINPKVPMAQLCSDPCAPALVDRARQDSLGVSIREMPQILCDAARYFSSLGVKDAANFVDMAPSRCSVQCRVSHSSKRRSSVCMNAWLTYIQVSDCH